VAVEKLRAVLGAAQPTLAALPPSNGAHDTGPLVDVVGQALREFGGGLDAEVVPAAPAGSDPAAEALARAAYLQGERRIRPSWIPGPAEAGAALTAMARSGELLRHIVASVFRVAAGFALAAILGIPFGLALGTFAWLHAFANAVIQCLRPISPIAWLPVATLALGGGDLAAIFLIFLASFFPIAVSTAAAVATVDLKYRRSAENLGVGGLAAARRVILPAALPAILTTLRIALGISWLVVVAAEMLGVEAGLGYLVLDARNQLRYDRVVAAMIVIGLIGLLIDGIVRRFERDELERRGLRDPMRQGAR
jgi:NitT/TauT family transport system permease protein